MSGVEVLGLVTGVMTVITFAAQTATVCKSLYDGVQLPDEDLRWRSDHMLNAVLKMQKQCGAVRPVSQDESRLVDVARRCQHVALELKKETDAIRIMNRRKSFLRALRSALKSQLGRSKINKLEKELGGYEHTLQTQLLVNLYSKYCTSGFEQTDSFRQLSEEVKYSISQYEAGRRNLSDLVISEHRETRKQIEQSEARIKNQVAQGIGQIQETSTSENQRARLLQSLKYSGMNERRNHITESHAKTFRWVLGESSADESTDWPSFISWSKSATTSTYWISGKPGSGKSTLVKYLSENRAVKAALNEWQPGTEIFSHYFWKPGRGMQSSCKGLWCSLAHQKLSRNIKAINDVLVTFPVAWEKEEPSDWSLSQLEEVCLFTLARDTKPVCIFIDGLDEIDHSEGLPVLRDAISKILDALGANVKLCLASRPEDRFRFWLKDLPQLKLHLLTKNDMEEIVHSKLEKHPAALDNANNTRAMKRISRALTERAEGVFIWLLLALRSVILGLEAGDTNQEIMQRINQLPRAIEDLYADMWQRLNENQSIYRARGAQYFNVLLAHGTFIATFGLRSQTPYLNLGHMLLATDPDLWERLNMDYPEEFEFAEPEAKTLDDERQRYFEKNRSDLVFHCEQLERDIEKRCAGLIEVISSSDNVCDSRVTFIHRTAYDFLTSTVGGREILSHDKSSSEEVALKLVKGHLGWLCIAGPVKSFNSIPMMIYITESIAKVEGADEAGNIFRLATVFYTQVSHNNVGVINHRTAEENLHDFLIAALTKCKGALIRHVLDTMSILSNSAAVATRILQDLLLEYKVTYLEPDNMLFTEIIPDAIPGLLELGANPLVVPPSPTLANSGPGNVVQYLLQQCLEDLRPSRRTTGRFIRTEMFEILPLVLPSPAALSQKFSLKLELSGSTWRPASDSTYRSFIPIQLNKDESEEKDMNGEDSATRMALGRVISDAEKVYLYFSVDLNYLLYPIITHRRLPESLATIKEQLQKLYDGAAKAPAKLSGFAIPHMSLQNSGFCFRAQRSQFAIDNPADFWEAYPTMQDLLSALGCRDTSLSEFAFNGVRGGLLEEFLGGEEDFLNSR